MEIILDFSTVAQTHMYIQMKNALIFFKANKYGMSHCFIL